MKYVSLLIVFVLSLITIGAMKTANADEVRYVLATPAVTSDGRKLNIEVHFTEFLTEDDVRDAITHIRYAVKGNRFSADGRRVNPKIVNHVYERLKWYNFPVRYVVRRGNITVCDDEKCKRY